MQSRLNPYISFENSQAREAMEFYKTVFGGKLHLSTYKEGGMPLDPNEDGNKIMHGMLEADNGMVLMGADNPNHVPYTKGNNISLSLSGDNDAELSGHFEKLSAGGKVDEPLVKAPWGDKFGMLTDKFDIHWMVNITGANKDAKAAS